jgi:hypothetical protein
VIGLAVIAQAYSISAPDADVPVTPRITLHPAGPVPCTIAAR